MQQFITVRVYTMAQCSHSDLSSYKNLPQSDCRDSELLQQEATAAAEEEETLTQTTEHRADRSLTKHTIHIHTNILRTYEMHLLISYILVPLKRATLL